MQPANNEQQKTRRKRPRQENNQQDLPTSSHVEKKRRAEELGGSLYGRITRNIRCDRLLLRAGENVRILQRMTCEDGHLFFCQCLGDDASKYLIPEDFVREINADELELREAIVIRNYAPVNAKYKELFKLDVVTILNDHDTHFFKVRYDDGTYTFVLKDLICVTLRVAL